MCDKDMASNQLTTTTVEKIPLNEELEVPTISVIHGESIYL